ncbi:MAG: TetR/AcrR family transcriptional regulator [Clostridia bacterium]|nr:TetR/AcrR family transcriptional regulator [Clostridia bacterium]
MPKSLANIKEDILAVTRKLLSEYGYEKLNIRTIASRSGIATGTLYNYYKSKQEIVEEILRAEWNMMLRRIDQASKADISLLEKLGTIYNELVFLMNFVHNIWFEGPSFSDVDDNQIAQIKCCKKVLLKSLTDKVKQLLGKVEREDSEFLADVICTLFISYAYRGDVEFKKLSPVIEALLQPR